MTAVAGFVCADGIVLCADSELTYPEGMKCQEKKLDGFYREDGGIGVVMAGAGDWEYTKMAYHKIKMRLIHTAPDLIQIEKAIEETVLEIYERHIAAYGASWGDQKPSFELLLGIRAPAADLVLVKTIDTAISRSYGFELLGTGRPFCRYLADLLYDPIMTVKQGLFLAVYILRIAKRYADKCGKSTDIYVLHRTGKIEWKSIFLNALGIEASFDDIDYAIAPIILALSDDELLDERFQEKIARFNHVAKIVREHFKYVIGFDRPAKDSSK